MGIDHLAEGIVHAAVEGDGSGATVVCALRRLSAFGGLSRLCRGGHGAAGAEGGAAVGGGAYAAMDIERGHAAGHVGHIDPKDGLALAIVERHIVEGHVDAGVVGASDAEIGVTDAQSVVAGGDECGSRGEQEGEVLSRVGVIELLAIELGVVVSDLRYRRVYSNLI